VALAVEATDRVRANIPGVIGDHYRFIDSAGSDPGCISSGCAPAQVAQTDAFEWITRVQTQLPGGVGVICWDSTPNDGEGGHISSPTPWDPMCDGDATAGIIAVKVAWDHDRDSGAQDRGEAGPETDFVVYRMSIRP
jgi:type IV pilus assembly protein PilV